MFIQNNSGMNYSFLFPSLTNQPKKKKDNETIDIILKFFTYKISSMISEKFFLFWFSIINLFEWKSFMIIGIVLNGIRLIIIWNNLNKRCLCMTSISWRYFYPKKNFIIPNNSPINIISTTNFQHYHFFIRAK